jgi:hypothetical protein
MKGYGCGIELSNPMKHQRTIALQNNVLLKKNTFKHNFMTVINYSWQNKTKKINFYLFKKGC